MGYEDYPQQDVVAGELMEQAVSRLDEYCKYSPSHVGVGQDTTGHSGMMRFLKAKHSVKV